MENQEALEVREDLAVVALAVAVAAAAALVVGVVALEEKVVAEAVKVKDYFKSLMMMLPLSATMTKL